MADILEVVKALEAEAFFPGASIAADGKIHRFKRNNDDKAKSGWYLCHQNHSDKGDVFYVALFGDWREQGNEYKFISQFTQTKNDRRKIDEQLAAAEAKRKKEQELKWEETSVECNARWASFSDNPESAYLDRKGLDQLYGCKSQIDPASSGRSIYVPVRDPDGKLWGFQKLQEDGQKFFFPGTKKTGNFHVIGGELDADGIIYLAEGFATGASIFKAIGRPVVVCFDAGNLEPVGNVLRAKFKKARFVICGDDDRFTDSGNAGRDKAETAAKALLGKAVFPIFKQNPERWTDFNDLHLAEGLAAVKAIILDAKPEIYRVFTLGHEGENYYYISSANQQIKTMTATSHSKHNLMDLMPKEYWESQYPNKTGADWDEAANDLMKACRKVGIFQPEHVRGVGVWIDKPGTVVNIGNAVWVNGEVQPLNSFASRYTYEAGRKIPAPHESPLPLAECQKLVSAIELCHWKKSEHAKYLMGWMVVAPLAGALQWRPHLWLLAASGSGKSFLMQNLVNKIFGEMRHFAQGCTTEAGLRQRVSSDAKPVIFDEFETDDEKSAERISSILELLRQASSESDGFVMKGGAGGQGMQYRVRMSAMVCSVRLNLQREQDKNRFALIELDRPGEGRVEHLKALKKAMGDLDLEYGLRLFSRSVRMLPTILANRDRFSEVLSERYNSRFGQQYGALLAGYAALISDSILTVEQAEHIVDKLSLTEETDVVHERDELDCVDFLLKKVVRVDLLSDGMADRSIAEVIQGARFGQGVSQTYQDALVRMGLKVEGTHLWVANNHPELQKLFKNTKWTTGWKKPLSRVEGAEHSKLIRFGSLVSRAVGIPLK